MTIPLDELARHLLPLSSPPTGPSWNHAMLDGLRPRGPQTDAAVLLALRSGESGPEMLFTRRNESLNQHAGQVSFPGGRVDPEDADMTAAAIREANEEIALPPAAVRPLGYLDCLDTTSGYRITPVVARVIGQPVLRPQPAEVAELFSVPFDYLLDPTNYHERQIDTPVGQRSVSEIRHNGQVIWGATALILTNLLKRLGIR